MISNVSGYEPYEEMNARDAFIMWPENYDVPENSSNERGALLGYVNKFKICLHIESGFIPC